MEKSPMQLQTNDLPGGGSTSVAGDVTPNGNIGNNPGTDDNNIAEPTTSDLEDDDEDEEDDEDDEDETASNEILLVERRKLITDLIRTCNNGNEGDIMYLIPADYLSKFLNEPVSGFEELKSVLGPIDFNSFVDSNGRLYSENEEPVGTYNITPEIFNHLSSWFEIVGQVVTRRIIINDESGEKEVERFPPVFYLHSLGKKPVSYRHIHHGQDTSAITAITVSKTSTFQDLLDAIRVNFLKIPAKKTNPFRVWFMESKVELPQAITINAFVFDLTNKSLVHAGILDETLKSQGVNATSFHLLVETMDKKSPSSAGSFPVDTFLSHIDDSQYDFDKVLLQGGNLGLNNLGNTCYMNSALQCLLHVPEINYYFFYNLYKKELNFDNPIGNHGDVANSFGNLLKQSFESTSTKSVSCVSPREFKSTIGRYSSMFSGYMQQDSQEFLSWLLDALHEDLNRIHKKPVCVKPELKEDEIQDSEAIARLAETCWNQNRLRDDSVIVDLFTGMYQSTLVCPTCSKTSITFDPFNDLTLPLPISKKWYHTFTIVDLSDENVFKSGSKIVKFEVELNKNSNYDDLLKYLSSFFKVEASHLFLYEIFRNSFHCDFQLDYNRNKFLPISDIIKDCDEVFAYYIPHNPLTDFIVPVLNSVEDPDKSYKITDLFGIPLFIVLNKETDLYSFGTIRKKLEGAATVLTHADIKEQYEALLENTQNYTAKKFYSAKDFPVLNPKSQTNSEEADDEDLEDSGYDSDISLANPYVDVTFGFTVKVRNQSKATNRPRFSYIKKASEDRFINVPLNMPQAREFTELADALPELKRNYYHYPDFNKRLELEMEELANEVNENLASQEDESDDSRKAEDDQEENSQTRNKSDENEGFVLVDYESKGNPASTAQLSSSDEDTEAEQHLGSLFDDDSNPSVHIVPPTSNSVKPSNVNSPIDDEEEVSAGTSKNDNHPTLISKETVLLCDWNSQIHQQFFVEPSKQTWSNIPLQPNPELERNRARFEKQRNSKISLHECLRSFSVPEVLGEQDLWYCPRCMDHKQATKTIQIWSTGDILTIHLKRFQSARAFSDKIDMLVDFPIEGLDVSEFVSNQSTDNVYDLIGVDNHYGGLGGGHYTAYVKNFRDDKWYYCDDSRVTEVKDPKESITGAAYLLFYRKRSSKKTFLGGPKLSNVIANGRETFKNSLSIKKQYLAQIATQTADYKRAAEAFRKETEEARELIEKLAKNGEISQTEITLNGRVIGGIEDLGETDKQPGKKSRSFENVKKSSSPLISTPQFHFDKDETELDLYDIDKSEDDSDDNSRKQRLISKDTRSNKLVQIKSNGKQEVSSSPILGDTNNDNDNLSEINEI